MERRRFLLAAGCAVAAGGCLDEVSAPAPPSDADDSAAADPEVPETIAGAWPKPSFDAGRTNYTPETTGPADPIAELWRTDLGDLDDPSAFAVANETLYVPGDGTVGALEATTGERRWTLAVDDASDLELLGVDQDRLVLLGDDAVVCLDVEDGGERWRVDVPGVVDAVTATDGGVYTVALVDDEPTVVALEGDGGDERWTVELEGFASTGGVIAGDQYLIVWTHGNVGSWWIMDRTTGESVDERGGGTHVPMPVTYRDGTAFRVDPFYGHVAASAVGDEGRSWHASLDGYGPHRVPVAAGPERLYVAPREGEAGVSAFDAADGERLWHHEREGVDRIVGCEEAVLASTSEGLVCLDPADGEKRWGAEGDGLEWFCAVDDLVYLLRDGGIELHRET